MSDSSLAIAQSAVTTRAAATQQALQTEMLRQQADSDQAVVELLQERRAAEGSAAGRAGQGRRHHGVSLRHARLAGVQAIPDPSPVAHGVHHA